MPTRDICQIILEATNQAIAGGSRCPRDYFERGNAFAGLGRHDEAVSDYEAVIEIDPRYDEDAGMSGAAWFNRGCSLAALGKYDEAIQSFRQCIVHGPDLRDHAGEALEKVNDLRDRGFDEGD